MRPDHDPLPGEAFPGLLGRPVPGVGGWLGIWGRNCVHQGAGDVVEVRFGTFGREGSWVGATVGRPLGRLGTRFNRPFRPLPLVPVVPGWDEEETAPPTADGPDP